MVPNKRSCIAFALYALTLLGVPVVFARRGGDGEDGTTAVGKDADTHVLDEITNTQHRLEKNHDYMTRWLQGLPLMPPNHSPESEEWSNSMAVCSIMRDENVTDVIEWLRYYRWLGMDHVFLTDNNSTNAEDTIATLTAAFPSDFLTVREERMPKAQLKAYAWCAEEHRLSYNWMGFFDLDEYLVLRGDHAADPSTGKRPNLKEFLDGYKLEPGLSVNWIAVGPSGRANRPEAGGVLPYYNQCVSGADRHVKTIVNTWFLDGVALHPHNFHFRGSAGSVNENLNRLEEVWMPLPKNIQPNQWKGTQCTQAFESSSPQLRIHCYKTAAPLFRNGTVEHVALFHYATKSAEDFKNKMARGSGMSLRAKGYDYFNEILKKQTRDPLCKEPSKLFDACCSPDAVARLSSQPAISFQNNHATGGQQQELHSQTERRDGGPADYYMSIQYFTKHVSKRTVVQPGGILTDVTVARALVMLSSILMVSFVVLVAMVVLLWNRRSSFKGMGKRSLSNDMILSALV